MPYDEGTKEKINDAYRQVADLLRRKEEQFAQIARECVANGYSPSGTEFDLRARAVEEEIDSNINTLYFFLFRNILLFVDALNFV